VHILHFEGSNTLKFDKYILNNIFMINSSYIFMINLFGDINVNIIFLYFQSNLKNLLTSRNVK
jgi:hypothetical protein